MKRHILTLVAIAFTLSMTAQTEVLKINLGDTVVTYKVADIQEMTFETIEEQVDTTLFHSFNGYLTVSTKYFQDSYYGNDAQLAVYKTSAGEYIVTFSDPTWGEGVFSNVTVGRELQGEGTIKMSNPQGGLSMEYAATISGPMTTPVITIPSVMGGTTITFHVGTPPVGYLVAGKYETVRFVTIPDMPQMGVVKTDTVQVTIATGSDPSTVNITLPSCTYNHMELPALTIEGLVVTANEDGSYTIAESNYDLSSEQGSAKGTISGTIQTDHTIALRITEQFGNMPLILAMEYYTTGTAPYPDFHVKTGTYYGTVSVIVGGQFGPYTYEEATYFITPNDDGTIDVEIPAYKLTGTVMGDLYLGSYTIKNLAYSTEGTYHRDYSADGLTFHLKAVNNGDVTMDNDYSFTKLGVIDVIPTTNGVEIINQFQPGAMPFPIVSTFEGGYVALP